MGKGLYRAKSVYDDCYGINPYIEGVDFMYVAHNPLKCILIDSNGLHYEVMRDTLQIWDGGRYVDYECKDSQK